MQSEVLESGSDNKLSLTIPHIAILGIIAKEYFKKSGPKPMVSWAVGAEPRITIGNDLWVAEGRQNGVYVERKVNYFAPVLGTKNVGLLIPYEALESLKLELADIL